PSGVIVCQEASSFMNNEFEMKQRPSAYHGGRAPRRGRSYFPHESRFILTRTLIFFPPGARPSRARGLGGKAIPRHIWTNSPVRNNTTPNDRRNAALAAWRTANPRLVISYTLPLAKSDLEQNSINLLQNAQVHGVNVNVVNIMTMDYANDNSDMGANAISASN